jgi:TPR repeat protein
MKAANNGDSYAINNLGVMYLNGYYVAKDRNKAVEMFNTSANIGNIKAMTNLGNIYYAEQNYRDAYILV